MSSIHKLPKTNIASNKDSDESKVVKRAARKYALSVGWILILTFVAGIVGSISYSTSSTLFGLGIEETSIVAMVTVVSLLGFAEVVFKLQGMNRQSTELPEKTIEEHKSQEAQTEISADTSLYPMKKLNQQLPEAVQLPPDVAERTAAKEETGVSQRASVPAGWLSNREGDEQLYKLIEPDEIDSQAGRNSRFFLTGLYIGIVFLFIAVWIEGGTDYSINYFVNIYLVIPLFGALLGFNRLHSARQMHATYYRVLTLFCTGFLLWTLGAMIWMYYNFALHDSIPYPSWADAGYLSGLLCISVGLILLCRIIGTNLLNELGKIAPYLLTVWAVTVFLMLFAHGGSPSIYSPTKELFKFLLDISYPIIEAFNTSLLAMLVFGLSIEYFDLKLKKPVLILFLGSILLFVADTSFNMSTSFPEGHPLAYYNGGWTDFAYATGFFLYSIGMSYIPLPTRTSSTQARLGNTHEDRYSEGLDRETN